MSGWQGLTYAWAEGLVQGLAEAGVQRACICPGSRSTPLALSLDRQRAIACWVHMDERAAGFFALGMAKVTGEPVALLCSSGTAAANFLPAVVEASLSHVPLIVLTADRPPEVRGFGAAQTIDQVGLYGSHVKWSLDLAAPFAGATATRYVRAVAARAVASANGAPQGVVHLNIPLREPLVPEPLTTAPDWYSERAPVPVVAAAHGMSEVDGRLPELPPRGLIVVGPDPGLAAPEQILKLGSHLGYPVVADPLSGLRAGMGAPQGLIAAYDAFLRAPKVHAALRPDVVLRFGALPTSRALNEFVQWSGAQQWLFDAAGYRDPYFGAAGVFNGPVDGWVRALLQRSAPAFDESFSRLWMRMEDRAQEALDAALQKLPTSFEGRVFREMSRCLPEDSMLCVGNSMPVRDLDSFFAPRGGALRILANRGANGIDGVVSTALGASAIHRGPAYLVIGDVSFFHDLNGLLMAKKYRLNLNVVLMHNDGGGIFSFLPQAESFAQEQFEPYFGTPHGLDFQPAVAMYGGSYQLIKDGFDWPHWLKTVGGLRVLAVPGDRAQNVQAHGAVWNAVAEAVTVP